MKLTPKGSSQITFVQCKPSRFNRCVRTGLFSTKPKAEQSSNLTKLEIAELSRVTIDQMTAEELVMVIRSADLPMLPDSQTEHRLPDSDLKTLRLLAYLARFSCQNQCQGC